MGFTHLLCVYNVLNCNNCINCLFVVYSLLVRVVIVLVVLDNKPLPLCVIVEHNLIFISFRYDSYSRR